MIFNTRAHTHTKEKKSAYLRILVNIIREWDPMSWWHCPISTVIVIYDMVCRGVHAMQI